MPAFSHEKHYILSSELKHLYVAVTRARRNILICEENTEYSMPIREYWECWKEDDEKKEDQKKDDRKRDQKNVNDYQKLVRVETISNLKQAKELFSNLAKKSSPDEWNRKGRDYFEQRQYEQVKYL